MSLNWKEIDAVLTELDLVGAQLQRIVQPAWDTVVLSFYQASHGGSGGRASQLLCCVAHGACRLHETSYAIPKTVKPQRFTELLRAHVRNARVSSLVQLGSERIVRIGLEQGDGAYWLYLRLWSGAANLILTRPDGLIVDCLARKPARGEITGGLYQPVAAAEAPAKDFVVRDLPGDGNFNQRVDQYYASHGSELSRDALLVKARAWLQTRQATLDGRLASLQAKAKAWADPERFRELGDILMANLHQQPVARLSCDDFYRGGSVVIPLDLSKSLVDNANRLYERAKKARSGSRETAVELAALQTSLDELASLRLRIEAEANPHQIRALLLKWRQTQVQGERRFPGLSVERNGWLILIGRSSAENDQLLRGHVRGSDTWLHARDHAGAYVFIKARRDKSIPLDILLDAGSLALYYSKARKNGQTDLYYTQVKYLRRAKNGPKGLVIPTQEKNLHIKLEELRLRSLRRQIGQDDEPG